MPVNTLELAKQYQTELDRQVVQLATSGWMDANAGQVKYSGGSEIKIPDIVVQGLADYDRDTGFNRGAVTFKYQTHTMTMDRGRTFSLDAMDVDETNFGVAAANVLAEFQRTQVIPEIDAYRYSKVAAVAADKEQSEDYTVAEGTVLAKLYSHLYKLTDLGVDLSQIVIAIAYKSYAVLVNNDKIQKKLDVGQFKQGDVSLSIRSLEGVPLIPVASTRMKSAYVFNDGTTAGQTAGGFAAAAGAVDINWLVMNRTAPIGIAKTDTVRIFDPRINQTADAWKIDYRKYHDLIIPDNKALTVFACLTPAA